MSDDTKPAVNPSFVFAATVLLQMATVIAICVLGVVVSLHEPGCHCVTPTDGSSARLESHEGRLHALENEMRQVQRRLGIPLGSTAPSDEETSKP